MKRTYLPAIAFAALFGISIVAVRWMGPDPDPGLEQAPIYLAWVSIVGAISSVILGWEADRKSTKALTE